MYPAFYLILLSPSPKYHLIMEFISLSVQRSHICLVLLYSVSAEAGYIPAKAQNYNCPFLYIIDSNRVAVIPYCNKLNFLFLLCELKNYLNNCYMQIPCRREAVGYIAISYEQASSSYKQEPYYRATVLPPPDPKNKIPAIFINPRQPVKSQELL